MPYIDKNESGTITGVYTAAQYDGQEFIDDSSQEYLDFINQNSSSPSQDQLWSAYQRQALAILVSNDTVAIRCIKAGIPYPKEWLDCDIALRAIMHAPSGDPKQPLPVQPVTRPAGT